MLRRLPSDIGGYVLAGGQSSRMGRDKALLELAGRPLVEHAVTKLRSVCTDVRILSDKRELAEYAPLVSDIHPGCGPMGGLEAALEHSRHEWNLFVPVDVPFLPSAFLDRWIRSVIAGTKRGIRVAMFTVGGVPQPLLCLLHREVEPFMREAMQRGDYKVFPALAAAAGELAARNGLPPGKALLNLPWDEHAEIGQEMGDIKGEAWWDLTEAQQAAQHLWFANLNTPEEFAEAELHIDALDT